MKINCQALVRSLTFSYALKKRIASATGDNLHHCYSVTNDMVDKYSDKVKKEYLRMPQPSNLDGYYYIANPCPPKLLSNLYSDF